MQRDEHCPALRIGNCRAIIKRGVIVSLPRLHDLKSLLLQRSPHFHCEFQRNVTLLNSPGSARTQVYSAVCRVQHDDVECALLGLSARRGSSLYRRCALTRGRGRSEGRCACAGWLLRLRRSLPSKRRHRACKKQESCSASGKRFSSRGVSHNDQHIKSVRRGHLEFRRRSLPAAGKHAAPFCEPDHRGYGFEPRCSAARSRVRVNAAPTFLSWPPASNSHSLTVHSCLPILCFASLPTVLAYLQQPYPISRLPCRHLPWGPCRCSPRWPSNRPVLTQPLAAFRLLCPEAPTRTARIRHPYPGRPLLPISDRAHPAPSLRRLSR